MPDLTTQSGKRHAYSLYSRSWLMLMISKIKKIIISAKWRHKAALKMIQGSSANVSELICHLNRVEVILLVQYHLEHVDKNSQYLENTVNW